MKFNPKPANGGMTCTAVPIDKTPISPAATTAKRTQRGPTQGAKAIDRMIQDWLATQAPELRLTPRSTAEIARLLPSLSGRAAHPRTADIAVALRRLGWVQKRTWKEARYSRVWWPSN
jgi:hypothetical protein